MLNTEALSQFLTQNTHPQLYARIMYAGYSLLAVGYTDILHSVLTTKGRVIAYSTPADGSQVRDQATLVSMLWDEHVDNNDMRNPRQPRAPESKSNTLQSLVIEYGPYNIIAQRIDADFLLVLIGSPIPGREHRELLVHAIKGSDVTDGHDAGKEQMAPTVIQRRKARAMSHYIGQQTHRQGALEER